MATAKKQTNYKYDQEDVAKLFQMAEIEVYRDNPDAPKKIRLKRADQKIREMHKKGLSIDDQMERYDALDLINDMATDLALSAMEKEIGDPELVDLIAQYVDDLYGYLMSPLHYGNPNLR